MKTSMHFRNAFDMQLHSQNISDHELLAIKQAWERDICVIDRLREAGVEVRLNDEESDERGYTATLKDGQKVSGATRTEVIRKLLELF